MTKSVCLTHIAGSVIVCSESFESSGIFHRPLRLYSRFESPLYILMFYFHNSNNKRYHTRSNPDRWLLLKLRPKLLDCNGEKIHFPLHTSSWLYCIVSNLVIATNYYFVLWIVFSIQSFESHRLHILIVFSIETGVSFHMLDCFFFFDLMLSVYRCQLALLMFFPSGPHTAYSYDDVITCSLRLTSSLGLLLDHLRHET